MLTYFRSLTPKTQKALEWFIQHATKTKSRKGGGRRILMTESTRSRGVEATFGLLRNLGVNGVELIDKAMVEPLMATPDPNNPEYRRLARDIHDARPVFRCCVEKNIITGNPFESISDDRFDENAQRDFIVPDDLNKLLDLGTVDLSDDLQVRDRLVCLLYVDSGLRRDELVSLRLDQVQHNKKGYWLRLLPENQKGQKPAITLPLLYDATETLLKHYLTNVRPKHGGDAFIINNRGGAASGAVCASAVQREAARLGIKTYLGGQVAPHCLRRTFGTCNVDPIGLCLDIAFIAGRLRNGIDITYRHYIQDNPLLQEYKATEIKARTRGGIGGRQMNDETLLMALSQADVDPATIRLVKGELASKIADAPGEVGEGNDALDAVEHMSEEDTAAAIASAWGTCPVVRSLRDYFRDVNALHRQGQKGKVCYAKHKVVDLCEKYVPIGNLVPDLQQARSLRRITAEFPGIRIGRVKIIATKDISRLMASVNAYRDRNRKFGQIQQNRMAKFSKTGRKERCDNT